MNRRHSYRLVGHPDIDPVRVHHTGPPDAADHLRRLPIYRYNYGRVDLDRRVWKWLSGIDAGEFFQVERDRFCDAVCEWSTVCGPGRRRVIAAKRDDPRVVAADTWRSDRAGRAGEDES